MQRARSPQRGWIELVVGPMMAGKTTELMRRLTRHMMAGRKCLLLKHAIDTRYDADMCCTHDGRRMAARAVTSLAGADISDMEVIGVDEGQFFGDLLQFVTKAADSGKVVIVAALDGTYNATPFGHVHELLPVAESITKLSAVCSICGEDAHFTIRTGSDWGNAETTVVGGPERYAAVCRSCRLIQLNHHHTGLGNSSENL